MRVPAVHRLVSIIPAQSTIPNNQASDHQKAHSRVLIIPLDAQPGPLSRSLPVSIPISLSLSLSVSLSGSRFIYTCKQKTTRYDANIYIYIQTKIKSLSPTLKLQVTKSHDIARFGSFRRPLQLHAAQDELLPLLCLCARARRASGFPISSCEGAGIWELETRNSGLGSKCKEDA